MLAQIGGSAAGMFLPLYVQPESIAAMRFRPRSWWVQAFLALLGGAFFAYLGMWATWWLGYAFFVRQPVHHVQDGYSIVDTGLAVGLLFGILVFTVLLILQRR